MEDKISLFYKSAGSLVNYYWNLDVKFYNTDTCNLLIKDATACRPDIIRKYLKQLSLKYSDKINIGDAEFKKAMKNIIDIRVSPMSVTDFKNNYSFTYFNYCLHGNKLKIDEATAV